MTRLGTLLAVVVPAWAVLLFLASDYPVPGAPAPRPRDKAIRVAVTKGQVSLNGCQLALPVERKQLLKALGEPSRETKLANTLLTWDRQGLFAYQAPESSQIISIAVALDRQDYDFWPEKPFAGALTVDGAPVTARSTIEQINEAKKGRRFKKDDLLERSWSIQYGQVLIVLEEADPDVKREGATFCELSLSVPHRQ